jgi:hypothetical protein
MKLVWHSSLMFCSFILLPASLIFMIYSVGAMVLLGQVYTFGWGVTSFCMAILLQTVLAVLSE